MTTNLTSSGHQYYVYFDKFASVSWVDPEGPFKNDLITGFLVALIESEKVLLNYLDPNGSLTASCKKAIGDFSDQYNLALAADEFVEAFFSFVIMSVTLALIWAILPPILNLFSKRFNSINPSHKKMYVIANMTKAILLGLQTLSFSWWKFEISVYWTRLPMLPIHLFLMKKVIGLYVVTDFIALFMVPKLPLSTKIHHYASTLLALFMMISHFSNQDIHVVHMVNVYGAFSTISFTTNLFLALRVMFKSSTMMRLLALVSFLIYSFACFGNWSAHVVWFVYQIINLELTVVATVYVLLLSSLVFDDLKLMSWLWGYAWGSHEQNESRKGSKDQQSLKATAVDANDASNLKKQKNSKCKNE